MVLGLYIFHERSLAIPEVAFGIEDDISDEDDGNGFNAVLFLCHDEERKKEEADQTLVPYVSDHITSLKERKEKRYCNS